MATGGRADHSPRNSTISSRETLRTLVAWRTSSRRLSSVHRSRPLLRLDDGHSFTLTPDRGPVFAELEEPGLYYSYAVGKTGRLVLMPRAEVLRQLA